MKYPGLCPLCGWRFGHIEQKLGMYTIRCHYCGFEVKPSRFIFVVQHRWNKEIKRLSRDRSHIRRRHLKGRER